MMKKVKINLGCGYRKKEDRINIDNRHSVSPDLVADLSKGMPFRDDSLDVVEAFDFIEHIDREDVSNLMDEVWRCLKPKGRFYHMTPSTDGRGAFQDPTHKSFWNINTWAFYFTHPEYRKLYDTKANFKILYLYDEWTDKANRVLHTHCGYEVIK